MAQPNNANKGGNANQGNIKPAPLGGHIRNSTTTDSPKTHTVSETVAPPKPPKGK